MESKIIITVILCTAIIFSAGCVETKQENYGIDSEIYVLDVSDWIIAENTYQKWNISDEEIREIANQYESKIGKPDENGYYKINSAEIAKLCGLDDSSAEEYVKSVSGYQYPTTHQIGKLRIESVRQIENISAPVVYWNNLLGWNLSEPEVSEIVLSLKSEFEKYYSASIYFPDKYYYTVSERVFIYRLGVLANLNQDSMTEFYNSHHAELQGNRWSPVAGSTEILKEFGKVQDTSKIYSWEQSGGLPYRNLEDILSKFGLELIGGDNGVYPDGNVYIVILKSETVGLLDDEDWNEIYEVLSSASESAGIYNLPVRFISYQIQTLGITPNPTLIPGENK